MRKSYLLCGLTCIVATDAMGQGRSGVSTRTALVGVSVDTYMTLCPSAPTKTFEAEFTFHVPDGGFGGPYASSGPKTFTAISNVGYKLTATVETSRNKYAIEGRLDASPWGATAVLLGQPITSGRGHTVDARLLGNPVGGLPAGLTTEGFLTVTIAAG